MRNYIKDMYCITRTLSEQQFEGLAIRAVDLEVSEENWWLLQRQIADDVNQSQIRYIKPAVSLENGRMKGYIRVRIADFTFNCYLRVEEERVIKFRKPHSRFY